LALLYKKKYKNEVKLVNFNKVNLSLLLIAMQLFLLFNTIGFAANHTLPDAIIELPANENAIIVEKATQTLYLYTFKAENLQVDFKTSCSTGESKGNKQKAGDKKTPEGIYFLNDEYEDKYLSPIYGKKAFPTDYPNFLDKMAGKNGSAIWIHGTNKELKPMDSNGCIALENSNVLKLANYINLDSTPVIMVKTIDKVAKDRLVKQKDDIHNMLSKWIQALETGTYQNYLSFYSSNYLPKIVWWTGWSKLRDKLGQETDTGESDLSFKLKIENRGIYYHDKVYVVLFDCFLTLENEKILLGKRKLFLEDDNYKIIGDVFQKISKKFQGKADPLIAAAQVLLNPDEKDVILKTIHHWLAAWSAKDMDKYALVYADNFYSDGLNKKKWVQRKQKLAKQYDYIHVSGKRFKVKLNKNMCEVVFSQKYESSGFTALGTKKLKLVNKGGLWKIYQESWKKK